MKKYFSWTIVILWMLFIFYFSHQPVTISNDLSLSITGKIVETIEKVLPSTGIGFEMDHVNHVVRKNAHFLIFLILGVITASALSVMGMKGRRKFGLALLLCILYAIIDESHQHFIEGRGPQVKDVLIDSAGALVGICLFFVIGRIIKNQV